MHLEPFGLSVHAFGWTGQENIIPTCRSAGNYYLPIQWIAETMTFHRSTELYEPVREKTNNLDFRPGPTQTSLSSHRSRLETSDFGFKKKRDCTIHNKQKTKAVTNFPVTAKLVCPFDFAYADCWFSHAVAHITLCRRIRHFQLSRRYDIRYTRNFNRFLGGISRLSENPIFMVPVHDQMCLITFMQSLYVFLKVSEVFQSKNNTRIVHRSHCMLRPGYVLIVSCHESRKSMWLARNRRQAK